MKEARYKQYIVHSPFVYNINTNKAGEWFPVTRRLSDRKGAQKEFLGAGHVLVPDHRCIQFVKVLLVVHLGFVYFLLEYYSSIKRSKKVQQIDVYIQHVV